MTRTKIPTLALSKSGIWVEGHTFLSACQNKLPCIFSCKTKTGDTLLDASCKKSLCMTSYGGIIRIRLKGRSWMTSSQPAARAPLFCLNVLYRYYVQFARCFFQKSAAACCAGFARFSAENRAGYGVFDHNHTDYGQKQSCRGRSPLRPVSYEEHKSDFFDTLEKRRSCLLRFMFFTR